MTSSHSEVSTALAAALPYRSISAFRKSYPTSPYCLSSEFNIFTALPPHLISQPTSMIHDLPIQVICKGPVSVSVKKDIVHIQGTWKITATVNFALLKFTATKVFIIRGVHNLLLVDLASEAAAYSRISKKCQ